MSSKTIWILLILVSIFLTACGQEIIPTVVQPLPPTPDLNVVRTEAAQTVVAGITSEAALFTPIPSSTMAPSATITVQTSFPAVVVVTNSYIPPATLSNWTTHPTITKTPYTDSASLEDQSPADGMTVSPGEDIYINWVFQNTGKRSWNSGFYFRPLASTLFPIPGGNQFVSGPIYPGDTYDFSVMVEAPDKAGIYYLKYVLMNDAGFGFFQFNFSIQVDG